MQAKQKFNFFLKQRDDLLLVSGRISQQTLTPTINNEEKMKKQLLSALALAATLLGLSANATSIQIPNYDVVSLNLNKDVFSFESAFVNFDQTATTAHLQVWHDVCPFKPGFINCKATPMLVLSN